MRMARVSSFVTSVAATRYLFVLRMPSVPISSTKYAFPLRPTLASPTGAQKSDTRVTPNGRTATLPTTNNRAVRLGWVRMRPILGRAYSERIPVLISGEAGFTVKSGGALVARIDAGRLLSGYVGEKARERIEGTFWLAEASLGRGRAVMFSERPTFRLGFEGALRVLFNALALHRR